jgi:chloramphenicol-sensitive protein RarD
VSARAGVAYAVAAFATWGVLPVYYKAVASVPALEVLAHRIVWSLLLLALLISWSRNWRQVRNAFADRRTRAWMLLSSLLVAVNWLIFIYAIAHDQIVECSLGYFINPLVNVLLGTWLLKEHLRPAQKVAVAIAAVAVAGLTISYGALPWISLVLSITFALYALVRKTVKVDAMAGLGVETMLLTPIALGYLFWLEGKGVGHFGHDTELSWLLVLAGPVTALPLLWFVSGARRLRFSTIGLLQYIAPTLHFLLGVLVYGEPFPPARAAAFVAVWVALAIFTTDGLRSYRNAQSRAET